MGPRVLVLALGCWVLGPRVVLGSLQPPQLKPEEGQWVPVGGLLHLRCSGPGPQFLLLRESRPEPLQIISSRGGLVLFPLAPLTAADAGRYRCRCRDPPGPPSNAVEVVVTDPRLPAPRLSLPPLQPLPAPTGTNVSVVCEGPPGPGTFRLYQGGPGRARGEQWVAGGGAVPFPLGPLHPHHEGTYVCTYSPEGGGVSGPSPPLLLLLQGGRATPKSPDWPGCKDWGEGN